MAALVSIQKFKEAFGIEGEIEYGRANAGKRRTAFFIDKNGVANTLFVGANTKIDKPLYVVENDGSMEGKEYLRGTLWVVNSNWKKEGAF
jgi:hypothetical protein